MPVLILLDIKLPKRNGFEVLEWLRKQKDSLRRTLVVMLTSSNHAVDIGRAYDLGVNSYLVKPLTSPQLKGCVPGEGCGTVTALYDAVAPGRADVNAKRTSCGEAMSCTGNLGFYRVTVVVAA